MPGPDGGTAAARAVAPAPPRPRQPVGQAFGETPAGVAVGGARRVGRQVQDQRGGVPPDQGLEEIADEARGLGEAVDQDGAGWQEAAVATLEELRGAHEETGPAGQAVVLHALDPVAGRLHHGEAPLPLLARGAFHHRLGDGLHVAAVQPGVHEVADGGGHGGVAVLQPPERVAERGLLRGQLADENLLHGGTARGRLLARTLEHLPGQRPVGLDHDAGQAAELPHQHGRQVPREAPRGHDDPHRRPELLRGARAMFLHPAQERPFGLPRSGGDEDRWHHVIHDYHHATSHGPVRAGVRDRVTGSLSKLELLVIM